VNATIVGMSALLTTTMTYMKTVVDGFDAAGKGHIKMAVGGAPISQMFADEIGADGYGANASAAVDLFLRLGGKVRVAWRATRSCTGRRFPRRSRRGRVDRRQRRTASEVHGED
jgi:cobalamin-dependent methionine synthase I